MSSATWDSAQPAHAMQQSRTGSAEESFVTLTKPFDHVKDDGNIPASRTFPQALDINSPTDSPSNKRPDTKGPGQNDKDSHRPWPKLDKPQSGSKRKRETNVADLPELPAHQQDCRPLHRWFYEPPTQEHYHGIAGVAEDCYPTPPAKGNDTKDH